MIGPTPSKPEKRVREHVANLAGRPGGHAWGLGPDDLVRQQAPGGRCSGDRSLDVVVRSLVRFLASSTKTLYLGSPHQRPTGGDPLFLASLTKADSVCR